MGLFGNNSSSYDKAKKTVKLVKDSSGSSAVSLEKVQSMAGLDLRKKVEAVGVSLKKRNMAGIRAQVVVLLDHSGSMYSDFTNGKVQQLTERFLGFGLQVDVDGEIPVIPFDSSVKSTVDVNLNNYKDVVSREIFRPNQMGSTNLTDALKELKKIVEKTDAPVFAAIITDGQPNDQSSAQKLVCELSCYPVFIKFLALNDVPFLQKLDDLSDSERLLDNVDTKEYRNLSSVTDEQFADDMADEWDSWTEAAMKAGVLEN